MTGHALGRMWAKGRPVKAGHGSPSDEPKTEVKIRFEFENAQ